MIGLEGRALTLLLYLMLLVVVRAGDSIHSAFSGLMCVSALAALYLFAASVLAISLLLAFKALHYLSGSLKLAHFIDLRLNYKIFLYHSTLHILSGKAYYEGSPLFTCVNPTLMPTILLYYLPDNIM
jgi:hypothetical protein